MSLKISTTPMLPGGPNAAYGLVESLESNIAAFRAIAQSIQKQCRATFGKTDLSPLEMAQFKQLVKTKMEAEKQKFFALLREAESVPPTAQLMPPPPPARDLYGRIADGSKVVDVGSGNCLRLQADTGRLRITAVDPNVDMEVPVTVKKVPRVIVKEDLEPGALVTSFNALCQVPNNEVKDAILSHDGLHLVPDHPVLVDMGCAVDLGEQVVVKVPNGEFVDYKTDCTGYKISAGYKLVPTYEGRKISFLSSEDFDTAEVGDYSPSIDCSPCNPGDMNWQDMGWKWDGVPLEFEVCDGAATITRRDGSFIKAVCHGADVDFSVHVEWMEEHRRLVLLRVECFNGMVPPHCGDTLRSFATTVNISWNGTPVLAPPLVDHAVGPVLDGLRCAIDGVITRVDQRDYYVKPAWTLDLLPDGVVELGERLRNMGKVLLPIQAQSGLWEYRLGKSEETYTLTPLRTRKDKSRATPFGTIEYLLGLPTIREMVAITGSSPEVERLACHFLEL